jgi:hypothetical protein
LKKSTNKFEKKRCLKINVALKDPKAVKIGIIEKYDVVEKYQLKNENFNLKQKIQHS